MNFKTTNFPNPSALHTKSSTIVDGENGKVSLTKLKRREKSSFGLAKKLFQVSQTHSMWSHYSWKCSFGSALHQENNWIIWLPDSSNSKAISSGETLLTTNERSNGFSFCSNQCWKLLSSNLPAAATDWNSIELRGFSTKQASRIATGRGLKSTMLCPMLRIKGASIVYNFIGFPRACFAVH